MGLGAMKSWVLVGTVVLLPLLSSTSRAQQSQLASPRPIFTVMFNDAQAEGVVQDSAGTVYVTVNQKWQDHGGSTGYRFSEAWVFALDGNSGEIIISNQVGGKGSNLGACMLLSDEKLLVINPATAESSLNDGIMGVNTDTLIVAWKSNMVRQSDKGVPPLTTPTTPENIVYYSSNGGIAVLNQQGLALWAATAVSSGQIAMTADSIYAVDRTPRQGFPLNVYNLGTGVMRGTSGPLNGAQTQGGVVLSPDEQHLYTVRSGFNGGLYRSRATFVFVPADVLTTEVSSARKFGPLISPDGNTIYIINPVEVLIEAYSMTEEKVLWRATQCPSIPPILSQDGTALYSFDCGGALVRLDTATSEIVWRMGTLPTGFTPSFLALADNDSRLLLSGQVFEQRMGYVYSVYTEDAVLPPPPTSSPTDPPMVPATTTPGPALQPIPPPPQSPDPEQPPDQPTGDTTARGQASGTESIFTWHSCWSIVLWLFVARVVQ